MFGRMYLVSVLCQQGIAPGAGFFALSFVHADIKHASAEAHLGV